MKRFLILTTDAKTLKWKSLPAKLAEIKKALKVWEIDIQHADVTPVIKDGRVDHDWLQRTTAPYLNEKYDLVALHMPMSQGKKQLNGANPKQGHDFYFWADENTKRKGYNQFVQTCLHEFAHEYFQKTGQFDVVHVEHDKTNDIRPFIETLDWSLFKTQRNVLTSIIGALQAQIKALTTAPTTLLHPVPAPFNKYITQSYGIASSRYPRTGRHIGTDYATPVSTLIVAPWDGKITTAGTGAHTGNFCHFEYTYKGQKWEERWCHLKTVPEIGAYRRGNVAAVTGNTGESTGPHLHRELWKEDVRVDLITKTNWSSLTADPEKHI